MTPGQAEYDSLRSMPLEERLEDWPNLQDGLFERMSEEGVYQNCVGFAVGIGLWVDSYSQSWPEELERGDTPEHYVAFFKKYGFEICTDGALESNFEKLAIYGKTHKYFNQKLFRHVALQQNDGRWKSKIGKLEDIAHSTPSIVCCGSYGDVVVFMRRPRNIS